MNIRVEIARRMERLEALKDSIARQPHLPEGVWCLVETEKPYGTVFTVYPEIITDPDRHGARAATMYLDRSGALQFAFCLIVAALFRIDSRLRS